MNLVFLNNYCFEQNIPGNTHIRCVPVDYVDEYPEFVMDGHNFVDDILLLPGKLWIILPCVAESIAFDEKETQTKHGPLTTPSIAAFIPSDTPNIAQVTNFMKSKEWIVLVHYKSGDVKVIGDMDAPARFGSSLTNGNDNKSKGYSINFFSSSKAKTFFIQSELPIGGGGACAPATYQLTLEGEPISGASGSIPSGTSAPIAIDDFVGASDPVVISVNGDLQVTAAAGTSSNVTTIDQDSTPIVPMAVNVSGNDIEIQVNVPELPDVGGLYKSGLTTSLIANDEGDTQQGDNPSFLRLNFTNCFGNDYILTGVLGGYQDEAGVYRLKDGTAAANRAAAFPDEIVINHSTWRPSVLTVWGLAYDGVPGVGASTIANFSTNFATIVNPATSIGGFVGGWMPASQRFLSMFPLKNEDADVMNYPPMSSYVTGTGGRWTGTRRDTGWVRFIANIGNPFNRQTTGNVLISTMRKFTFDPITETLS